jgi:hypothetical protein
VAILDLAVIALAVMVCVTLGLLAWTLGVTVPAAARRARHDVARARSQVAQAEARLRRLADRQGGR